MKRYIPLAATLVVAFGAGWLISRGPGRRGGDDPSTRTGGRSADQLESLLRRLEDLDRRSAERVRRLEERVGELRTFVPPRPGRPGADRRPAPDPTRVYEIRTEGAPALGPSGAPVTIVEFSDLECPFCTRVMKTLERLLEQYPDEVRLVFKHNPLPMHRHAMPAHLAAAAAAQQGKFWEMYGLLVRNRSKFDAESIRGHARALGLDMEKFEADISSREVRAIVEADLREARKLSIRSTPAFFVNGRYMTGAQPYSAFLDRVEAALKEVKRARVADRPAPDVTGSGETAVPEVPAELRGPRLEFETCAQDVGLMRPGATKTAVFDFRNAGDRPLTVKRPDKCCGIDSIELSSTRIPPSGTGRFTLRIPAGPTEGRFRRTLVIESDDVARRKTVLAVAGMVRALLRVEPPVIDLGATAPGERASRKVTVSSTDGRDFLVRSLEVDVPGVRVEAAGLDLPSASHSFVVAATPEGDPGALSGILSIATDRDQGGPTNVRVKLRVAAEGEPVAVATRPDESSHAKSPAEEGGKKGEISPAIEPATVAHADSLPVEESAGDATSRLQLWLFHSPGCPRCGQALAAVKKAAASRPGRVDLEIRHLGTDPEAIAEARTLLGAYPGSPLEPPAELVFVGTEVILGPAAIIRDVDRVVDAQLRKGGDGLKVRGASVARGEPGEVVETLALLPVVLAGLADGVNPCAFATMVLLVSILGGSAAYRNDPRRAFRAMLVGGATFCAGVFVTYYAAGVGLLLGAVSLGQYPVAESIVFWAVWLLAAGGALLSAADAVVYYRTGNPEHLLLKVPASLRRRFAPLMRGTFSAWGLAAGGLAGGVLIAILEGICTGQMYLPTIQYMARTPGLRLHGALWLLLYNALFMLPLVVILAAALSGVGFRRLNEFLRRHVGGVKLLLAFVFTVLAVAMLVQRVG